jgi:hypothetical protein
MPNRVPSLELPTLGYSDMPRMDLVGENTDDLLLQPSDPSSPAVTPHEPRHEPEDPSTEVGPIQTNS